MNGLKLDLNLLTVFEAVAETGSVTRAAARLGLSQPATSHALNRLRYVAGDPLFVRSRQGLVPTARAAEMRNGVSAVLQSARELLQARRFDPATTDRRFRIGTSDYAALSTGPVLLTALRKSAPGASIEFAQIGNHTMADLEHDRLDLTFWGAELPGAPFESETLYRETFVGVTGKGHALTKRRAKPVTLAQYLAFGHARVDIGGGSASPVDEAIGRLDGRRSIVVSTSGFASIIALLPGTDIVATIPQRLARTLPAAHFSTFVLPFQVPPFNYSLLWHRRHANDPAVGWLRQQIAVVASHSGRKGQP